MYALRNKIPYSLPTLTLIFTDYGYNEYLAEKLMCACSSLLK